MSETDPVRMELYVRSLLPESAASSQNEVIDALEELEAEGAIDEFTLLVWGDRAPASPGGTRTDAGLFALNRVAVFSEWAERNDRSIEPFFERRTVDSELADEHYQAVVFPRMTLAEYEGQDLRSVTPCRGPERADSVPDRVSRLRAAAADDRIEGTLADPDAGTTDDPDAATTAGSRTDRADPAAATTRLEPLERAYATPPRELTLVDTEEQG